MNEIQKQNDIFVSTLLNPQAQVSDLLANGFNASNTGLMDPATYRNSKFVLNYFKDENGNFKEEDFVKAYTAAYKQFDEMTSLKSYSDLQSKLTEYDSHDIFAPLNANRTTPTFEIKKVQNPYGTSKGISSLYGEGERTLSDRELAQQHKVWDEENKKWLDWAPEDRGVFSWIVKDPIIYATWDEDGQHFDKALGRNVWHRKGDFRTDDNGQYFCELAGDKQRYDKEFVSVSDTLTKEGTWLNSVDFFDSDGLTKSAWGTTFKLAASIAPYMIPYVNVYWGGITAAYGLASVMPTFAKMLEGVVLGDVETDFTRKMNAWENYFHAMDESYTDDQKESTWGYQKMASMVSDIFGQLYQMRAMSSLSLLRKSSISAKQSEMFGKFLEDFGESYARAAANPKSGLKPGIQGMTQWFYKQAENMPEIKKMIESQSKISKALSLGYMAMTSSADVYSDALAGGYDRRMAGIAALTATAGQYALMMNNSMGDWFLDATVGYKENISKSLMKDLMKENYELIAEGTKAIAKEATTEGKLNALAKVFNAVYNKGIKGFFNLIKDGGEEFWKRSIIEGVEEVTEEAVMDMTKGVFDTLSWMGIGKNSDTASFGGWENTFSASGLQRYVQNFVGGAIGGALFEFQGKVIEPGIKAAITGKVPPEVKTSIIREVALGHSKELKEAIHYWCTTDNDVNAQEIDWDKEKISIGSYPNVQTRGELIEARLNKWIDDVEAIVIENGASMSDEDVFKKIMRDEVLIPLLEDSEVHKLILKDFNQTVSDLVEARLKYSAQLEKDAKDESLKGKESDTAKKLKKDFEEQKKKFEEFMDGSNSAKYLEVALAYLHPLIRQKILNMDLYSYTQGKYGINFVDIPDDGSGLTKESVKKEYEEWKDSKQPEYKFIQYVIPAYSNLQQIISPAVQEYAQTYVNVRTKVLGEVLSAANIGFEENIGETSTQVVWRNILQKLTKNLGDAGQEGATLKDIFKVSDKVLDDIVEQATEPHLAVFERLAAVLNANKKEGETYEYTAEDAKKLYKEVLRQQLESYPVLNLDKRSLDNLSYLAMGNITTRIFEDMKAKKGEALTKEDVDRELTLLGFSPNPSLTITDENKLLDYFTFIIAPRIDPSVQVGIEQTMLKQYILENSNLDNEVLVPLKQIILKSILAKNQQLYEAVSSYKVTVTTKIDDDEYEETTGMLALTLDDLKLWEQKLRTGLNNNTPISDIIQDYLFNETDGIITVARKEDTEYQLLESERPDAAARITEIFEAITSSVGLTDLYENAASKQVVKNPLFELLRTFAFLVSGGEKSVLFDLLERESTHLSSLGSTDEYIRFGITLEEIMNFLQLLDLFQAIVVGSTETSLGMDNLVGFNQQMQRYHEKYGDSELATKFKTITPEACEALMSDLLLLQNKLKMLENIIRANTNSQVKEDANTEIAYENIILEHLLENASKLTLQGVSIMPPRDEIDKKETTSEKIAFIESQVRKNFLKIDKSKRKAAIAELFKILNINKQDILDNGTKSYGLSPKTRAISEYDLFVYWATILSTDQNEFLTKYGQLMQEPWFKMVPKFTQRIGMKTGYAFYADTEGIHDMFMEELYAGKSNTPMNKTSHIFFLNGISGAGKTSAVAKAINYMINPTDTTFIVGPNDNQATKLEKSVTTDIDGREVIKLNKEELLQIFLTKEAYKLLVDSSKNPGDDKSIIKEVETSKKNEKGENQYKYDINVTDKMFKSNLAKTAKLPKVIFIDEVTHFNTAELLILEKAAAKFGIKILTFGDTLQKGATLNGISCNVDNITLWASPRLLLSTRTQNSLLKDNIDAMTVKLIAIEDIINSKGNTRGTKAAVKSIIDQGLTLSYYQTDSELHGHKLVDKITKEEVQRIAAAAKAKGQKFGIIADMQGDDFKDARFGNMLKSLGLKLGEDYVIYSPDDNNRTHAVQGAEEEYIIIKDFNIESGASLRQSLTTVYTYLTRSLSGTVAVLPRSVINRLNITNTRLDHTDPYILPGTDDVETLRKQVVEKIKKLIGEEIPEPAPKTAPAAPATPKTSPAPAVPAGSKAVVKPVQPTSPDEDVEEAPKEELELIADDREQGENQDLALQSSAIMGYSMEIPEDEGSSPFERNTPSLWGHAAYAHAGLRTVKREQESKGRTLTYYYATQNNSRLDFDGLLPPTTPVTAEMRAGMIRLQNLLSFFPDTNSDDFKKGMADEYILKLFFNINPNWAVDEDGAMPTLESKQLQNVYNYLVNQDNLVIDPKAYVFGKKYDEDQDRATGFFAFKEDKDLKSGEPLLLYGYHIYTKGPDKSLNQYISVGAFPSNDKVDQFADYVPNGKKIRDAILKKLESKPFVVFLLNTHVFKPRTTLRIVTTDNTSDFFNLALLQSLGVIVSPKEIGLITSELNENGEFAFLEFMAEYESAGDEALKAAKLERFNKSPKEGGFVELGLDEDGQPIKKLVIAGLYFALSKFTQTDLDYFKRILILEPRALSVEDALRTVILLKRAALQRNATDTQKQKGKLFYRKRWLSSYSQSRLVIELLKKVGALTEDGDEVLAKDTSDQQYSVPKYYMQQLFKYFNSLSNLQGVDDYAVFQDFISEDKFNELSIMEFMKKTKLIGLVFVDFLLNENADHELTIKKLVPGVAEGKEERLILTGLADIDDVFMDFGFGKRRTIVSGSTTFEYHPIKLQTPENSQFELRDLGIRGHTIQMPIFNLFDFDLATYTEITKPLEREEPDRSILGAAKQREDTSDLSIEKQRKDFQARGRKEAKITSKTVVNAVIEDGRQPYTSYDKRTKKTRLNYVVVENLAGWQIIAGDKVQLFGNKKEYIVVFVDKKHSLEHKCIKVLDPDTKNVFQVYPDDISAVTTRFYANATDKKNGFYEQKNWQQRVLERLNKKEAIEKSKQIKKNKEKVVIAERFNTDHLDYDKFMFAVYAILPGEDFQEIALDSDNWALVSSEDEMDKFILDHLDDSLGIVILRFDRFSGKKPKFNNALDPEQKKKMEELIVNKYNNDKNIFGYVQNIVLFHGGFNHPLLEDESAAPKKKGKNTTTEKIKGVAIAKPYGDYTAEEFADLATYPGYDSVEAARNAGFKLDKFFLLRDGKIYPFPKVKFYTSHGFEVPGEELTSDPYFEVGDVIYTLSELDNSGKHRFLEPITITRIDASNYYYEYNGVERALPILNVDLLAEVKYISAEVVKSFREDLVINPVKETITEDNDEELTESISGLRLDGKEPYLPDLYALKQGEFFALHSVDEVAWLWNITKQQLNAIVDTLSDLTNPDEKEVLFVVLRTLALDGLNFTDFLVNDGSLNPDDALTAEDISEALLSELTEQYTSGKKKFRYAFDPDGHIDSDNTSFTSEDDNNCIF